MAAQSPIQPTESNTRERSNWAILSLLRFFLALVITLFHLGMYAHGWLAGCLDWLGPFEVVLGFLLISGYSIGASIIAKPEGFLSRRFWRIYPVYLAALILTFVLRHDSLNGTTVWIIFLNLFFLSQILIRDSYLDVGWSLTVEIWLYLFTPLLARLSLKSMERLVLFCFLCFAFYTCGRSLFHWRYYIQTLNGINLPTLGFIWLAGFYLAVSTTDKIRPLRLIGLLFIAYLLLVITIQFFHRIKQGEGVLFFSQDILTYLGNGTLFLVLFLVFRGVILHQFHFNLLSRQLLHFLGDISYPLYLVHFPIFAALSPYCQNTIFLLLIALFATLVIYYGCDFYSRRRKVA